MHHKVLPCASDSGGYRVPIPSIICESPSTMIPYSFGWLWPGKMI